MIVSEKKVEIAVKIVNKRESVNRRRMAEMGFRLR